MCKVFISNRLSLFFKGIDQWVNHTVERVIGTECNLHVPVSHLWRLWFLKYRIFSDNENIATFYMSQFTLLGKSMVKLKLLKTFFKFTLIFTFKKNCLWLW